MNHATAVADPEATRRAGEGAARGRWRRDRADRAGVLMLLQPFSLTLYG